MLVTMEQLNLELGHEFRALSADEHRRLLLRDIEHKALSTLKLGFKGKVLDVLDDPNSTSTDIEALKTQIDREVLGRLFDMSNSLYFGNLRVGETASFLDIVMRLGMKQTRTLILALSLFSVTKDRELRVYAARAFATLMLARMFATEAGYRKDVQERLELGGLMFEIGKVVMFVYKKYHARFHLKDEFIDAHHHEIGVKVIEKFNMPGFLKGIISERRLAFDEESYGVAGIVYLMNCAVDDTFKRYGKFVVSAPPSGVEKLGPAGCAAILREQFAALGIGDLIEVLEPGRRPRSSTVDTRSAF